MINRSTRAWLIAVIAGLLAAACADGSDRNGVQARTTAPVTTTVPTTRQTTSAPTSSASTIESTVVANTTGVQSDETSCVAELTPRDRVALLVWPAVYTDDWAGAVETVATNGVGGVLLMEPSGVDAEGLATLLRDLERESPNGLIVATDEEGGEVQRLSALAPLASQRDVSISLDSDGAVQLIATHGELVRDVGVDMVLGPVVDVTPNVGDVPLQRSRFFDGSPEAVAAYGAAYLDGWDQADVFAALKHYPGHGAASGDTHISPGVTPSLSDLEGFDLLPFRELATDVDRVQAAVMVGHLTVPGLTEGVPATRSPAAVKYLRDQLGYGDTLLITDALGMAAVGLAEPEAAVLALAAGIDVVLFTQTSQTTAVIDAIMQALDRGELDLDELTRAAGKVMTMLSRDGHSCLANASN